MVRVRATDGERLVIVRIKVWHALSGAQGVILSPAMPFAAQGVPPKANAKNVRCRATVEHMLHVFDFYVTD